MAVTTYTYARTKLTTGYDIENLARTNSGRQIHLAKEIKDALPSETFTFRCNRTECLITFQNALSAGDKTILDNTVSDHQNNV